MIIFLLLYTFRALLTFVYCPSASPSRLFSCSFVSFHFLPLYFSTESYLLFMNSDEFLSLPHQVTE